MKCAICGKKIKDGTGNNHHLYFPRARYKYSRRGRMTVPTHIMCHNQFHFYFLHTCLGPNRRQNCRDCQYVHICIYAVI